MAMKNKFINGISFFVSEPKQYHKHKEKKKCPPMFL